MNGVPASLDLTKFHGAELEQIALGEYVIQFRFGGVDRPELGVEGYWELRSQDGTIVDHAAQENDKRDAYRIHCLLGQSVTRTEVHAPNSILLQFTSGQSLEVFDHDEKYESFSIQPGDVFV